jgi:hypothetical protein
MWNIFYFGLGIKTNWTNFGRFEFDTIGDPRSTHILFLSRLKYNVPRLKWSVDYVLVFFLKKIRTFKFKIFRDLRTATWSPSSILRHLCTKGYIHYYHFLLGYLRWIERMFLYQSATSDPIFIDGYRESHFLLSKKTISWFWIHIFLKRDYVYRKL